MRTKDHIIPKSKGGRGQRGLNIVICCFKCNKIKADYSLDFFIAMMKEYGVYKGYTKEQVQKIIANANFLITTRIKVYGKELLKKDINE